MSKTETGSFFVCLGPLQLAHSDKRICLPRSKASSSTENVVLATLIEQCDCVPPIFARGAYFRPEQLMSIVVLVVLGYEFVLCFISFLKQLHEKRKWDTQDHADQKSVLFAIREHNRLPIALQEAVHDSLRQSYPGMPRIIPRQRVTRVQRGRAVRNFADELTAGEKRSILRPLDTDVISPISDFDCETSSFASKMVSSQCLPEFKEDAAEAGSDQGFVDHDGEMLKNFANPEWIKWFLNQHRKSEIFGTLRSATSKSYEGMQEHAKRNDAVVFLVHQVFLSIHPF